MNDGFFHLRNGFCFRRNEDGSITIEVREQMPRSYRVIAVVTVPPNEFASVVASVSARGEDGDTFQEAWDYLVRQPEPVAA